MRNTENRSPGETSKISSSPSSPGSRRKQLFTAGSAAAAAGFVASLVAAVLMGVLRLEAGIPTPVELFGDHVLKLLPAAKFVQLLITFGRNAKTEPLGLALLGMIALGTLLGLLYAPLVRAALPASGYRPARREWLVTAGLTIVMTLSAVALFWGELGQNFLGLPIEWASLATGLALLADFSLYSLALCVIYRALLPKQPVPGVSAQVQERRQLLARAGTAVLSLGAGAGTLGLIRGFLTSDSFTSYDGTETSAHNGFTAPITPNNEHYVVTQNPVDPAPNLDMWRLEITGLVGSPGIYTYEQLQNLPSTSRAITLDCISNGPGGRLISTAIWHGVTMRTLLEQHDGALPDARYVAFYSVDGYTISLPLHEVLEVDALLAWQMNGAPLPDRHGFPLRALVPGHYGEESPKWLARVELTGHFVGGLYSDQGWYNGPVHTWNRIDRPRGRVPLDSPVEVGGVAFAGTRGVRKVEVSVDGGMTWHQAQLEPSLSPDAWVLWSWQWLPTLAGRYMLEARVTDNTGQVQTSHEQGTVPNGATGYHIITVDVA